MALLKCKMCGGELQVEESTHYGTCVYCGSVTTLPPVTSQEMTDLYNRAEDFRQKCDFNSAINVYEKILEKNATEAEAHWGLVLAKFGIEYVKDPTSEERIPTCHRAHVESILADDNYLLAIKYAADGYTQSLYHSWAENIAAIQKKILAYSAKETPYDIFICYKETGADGERSADSVAAQEIYDKLTDKGYKVFFARITLEGKLGSAYEPVIFAALNSARAMLVLCSSAEYCNAVWVKNEWSRYILINSKDKSKQIIPCLLGMKKKDLPRELSMYQTQDLEKPGAVQDLVRGLGKIVDAGNNKNAGNKNPAAILREVKALEKKINQLIVNQDYITADDCCDSILIRDPSHAGAYFYKFLCECQISGTNMLFSVDPALASSENLKKYLKMGPAVEVGQLKQTVQKWMKLESEYERALKLEEKGRAAEAAVIFAALGDYKDSRERVKPLMGTAYKYALDLMNRKKYAKAADTFSVLGDHKDSPKFAEICYAKALVRKRISMGIAAAVCLLAVIAAVVVYRIYFNWQSVYDEFSREYKNVYHKEVQAVVAAGGVEIHVLPVSDRKKISLFRNAEEKWKALSDLYKAADRKEPAAMVKVAKRIFANKLPHQYEKAVNLYQEAAKRGHLEAALFLAGEYAKEDSEYVLPNQFYEGLNSVAAYRAGARQYAEKAYTLLKEHFPQKADEWELVGDFYSTAPGKMRDYKRAVNAYRKAILLLQLDYRVIMKSDLEEAVYCMKASTDLWQNITKVLPREVAQFKVTETPESAYKKSWEKVPERYQKMALSKLLLKSSDSMTVNSYKDYVRKAEQAKKLAQAKLDRTAETIVKADAFIERLNGILDIWRKLNSMENGKNPHANILMGDLLRTGVLGMVYKKKYGWFKEWVDIDSALRQYHKNSLHYYRKAADASAEGKIAYAKALWTSPGGKRYPEHVKKLLLDAAKFLKEHQEDPYNVYLMGRLYYDDVYLKQDYGKAYGFFKKAADKGVMEAAAYLGVCYLKGLGTARNTAAAHKYLRYAENRNSDLASAYLGYCYLNAQGVRFNYEYGFSLLKKSMSSFYGDGFFFAAEYQVENKMWDWDDFYENGNRAFDLGHLGFLKYFGSILFKNLSWWQNRRNFSGNYARRAQRVYKYCSLYYECGGRDKKMLNNLRIMYEHGVGCKKDKSMAEKLKKEIVGK